MWITTQDCIKYREIVMQTHIREHRVNLQQIVRHNFLLVIAGQALFLIVLLGIILVYLNSPYIDIQRFIYLASITLVFLFLWSIGSWYILTKKLFDPYALFFTAAVLFNGGQSFLAVFDLNKAGFLDGEFSSHIILKLLFMVILGLIAFHFGGILSRATDKGQLSKGTCFTAQSVRLVGWGLLFISILPVIFELKNAFIVVVSSGYSALFQREIGTGFNAANRVLSSFLIPAVMFLLAGSKGRKTEIIISGIAIVSYSMVGFFLGSRSRAVMPLIAYAWVWHRRISPIPPAVFIGSGIALIFIVFPVVRFTRNIAGAERLSFAVYRNTFSSIDNPFVVTLSGMGRSMQAVAYTLELVPKVRPFDIGQGYLYALLTVVPNLFWDVHPTVSHGLAGEWLTSVVAPAKFARGQGLGYSFIAEAYLNFGWIGVFPVLMIIGFLFGKFVLWGEKPREPAKMATLASFLSYFLFYARNELAPVIRFLSWYALLPYFLVILVSGLTRNLRKVSDR
jgi:oligosaccharide repeat unit polymerase